MIKGILSYLVKYKFSIASSLVIFILSLLPGGDMPKMHWHIKHLDKIVHAIFYAGLMVILLYESKMILISKKVFFAFLLCFAFGVIVEFLQGFLSNGRQFEVWDIVANTTGLLIGLFFCKVFLIRRPTNSDI